MQFPSHVRPTLVAALLAGGILSACASPDANIYTLAPQDSAMAVGRPISISIETVDLAKYLDRPQLVRRSGDVQLGVSEFERWGEPVGSMVQRVLAENLRRQLPAGSLVNTSQTVSGKEAASLELALSRFDMNADNVVVLQAQWRLHSRGAGAGRSVQANISVPSAGGEAPAQVQAMSIALDQLATQIARGLQ